MAYCWQSHEVLKRRDDRGSTACAAAQRAACRWTIAATVLMANLVAAGPAAAHPISKATASAAAREQAIHSIPFDRLTMEARQKIGQVVQQPTLYRRMPINQIECDANLFRFLVRNPEVVVNIWQLMGITRVSLQRADEYLFNAADGMGTTAKIELVYGDAQTHIFYCQGQYNGTLTPRPITGQCVLVLNAVTPSPHGTQITSCLDIFIQVDQLGVEVLTKTLQPIVGRSADRNFLETLGFVEKMSKTAAENGPGMQRLAARLEQATPAQRQQLAQLSALIHARALQMAASSSPVPSP